MNQIKVDEKIYTHVLLNKIYPVNSIHTHEELPRFINISVSFIVNTLKKNFEKYLFTLYMYMWFIYSNQVAKQDTKGKNIFVLRFKKK